MFRKTFTGSLVAASLTASALMFMPSASATPTFVHGTNISGAGSMPSDAAVAMSENGTTVATWIRDGRVMVSSAKGGVWFGTDFVSDPGKTVSDPSVTINNKGEAVLAWHQVDDNADVRVAVSRMDAFGAFGGPELIGQAATYDVKGPIDLGIDGAGKAFAAYRVSNNGAFNQVRVTTWDKAGADFTTAVSDTSAFSNSISVNDQGQAFVAYYDALNVDEVVNTRRYDPATKAWGNVKSVGLVGQYSGGVIATSLNDTGAGTVAYVKQDPDNDYRALVNKSNTNGTLGGGSYASTAGYSVANLSLDENDKGAALLAYDRVGGGNYVGYTQRSDAGNWTTPAIVNQPLSDITAPQASISDAGFAFIGWDDDGHQKAAHRSVIYQGMTTFDSGAQKYVSGETGVGIDNQGNVLLVGVIQGGDPADGIVSGKVLDTAGPTSAIAAPTKLTTIGTTIKVTRTASDRFSNVGNGSFRVRTAAYNGTFSTAKVLASGTAATTINFAGSPGRTYCFSSLATDSNGNVGGWSAEKCTTTPVDDRAGVIAKGFKRKAASSSYRGTYSFAKKKNAVMSFQHVKASRIAILVTKVANGGKIQVNFAGKRIGTYSLKGSGNKQLIGIKNLGSLKSGTLVIKVVSNTGKVVRIDGVVLAK